MIAPGTALREGIESILHAHTGGLIVIGEPEDLSFLNSGGIKLEIDYTPAFLYQVAKMDGAIILNANATRITMANVQLMPDPTILSHETGTRHRTAERVSKQTDALVIAISQRREVVSVYVDGMKYILEDIPVVLAKANQALATLDKFRTRLDQVSTRLTALEFEGGTTLHDVLTVLQRSELVTRMAVEIERYIVELGSEGRLIEMQLEETMVGASAEKSALVRDYLSSNSDDVFASALEEIGRLAHQDLLDFGRLAELLGYDRKLNTLDYPVAPRGYRILGRIPRLPKLIVEVFSPNDRMGKMLKRIAKFLKKGVAMAWLLDQEEETLTILMPNREPIVLERDEEVKGLKLLPDFHCKVAEFFAMPGE